MMLTNMQNGEAKQGFIRKLRAKFPELPEWLKFENHVKYIEETFPESERPEGIAPRQSQAEENHATP